MLEKDLFKDRQDKGWSGIVFSPKIIAITKEGVNNSASFTEKKARQWIRVCIVLLYSELRRLNHHFRDDNHIRERFSINTSLLC